MSVLIDSHCHIHDSDYDFVVNEVLEQAQQAQIAAMICVGTDVRSSAQAQAFCDQQDNCYYSLALHPHQVAKVDTKTLADQWQQIVTLAKSPKANGKLVAIGECGLDYFYHQDKQLMERQKQLLAWHLDLACQLKLPVIFHVRQAFDDFWPIYDKQPLAGVIHSFSDNPQRLKQLLSRPKLFCGLNGIMTFSRDQDQLEAARQLPLERLLLETDAPYLSPHPLRGKLNSPANLKLIADFLADLRSESLTKLAKTTTSNACQLFNIQLK